MRSKFLTTAIVISFVASACQNVPGSKQIKEQVISLHDSIMAKNDHVVHLEMKIDSLIKNMKTLSTQDSSLDTILFKKELNTLQEKLKSAEEKMNDWMYKFEPDESSKTEDAAKKYFNEQKDILLELKNQYDLSISESETFFSKTKK